MTVGANSKEQLNSQIHLFILFEAGNAQELKKLKLPFTVLLFSSESFATSSNTLSSLTTLERAGLVAPLLLIDIKSSIIVNSLTIMVPNLIKFH